MNIADVFAETARKRPDHAAIEDGGRIVSYAGLEALANTAAPLEPLKPDEAFREA